ncbi:hypothetical protein PGT21_034395 [Puccinia graminis f. sp. tritici]|uniref:Uncharacterized protein n=1 Tax=Puccinia graminis f. sp. tritici TaxID=56615 RepID=A0A5B0NI93_PUCGR|nr:hypothetical protein PGT21_034395 [Puccinia graminis f. sp. tritici]
MRLFGIAQQCTRPEGMYEPKIFSRQTTAPPTGSLANLTNSLPFLVGVVNHLSHGADQNAVPQKEGPCGTVMPNILWQTVSKAHYG